MQLTGEYELHEVLRDVKKSGREIRWGQLKRLNLYLSECYKRLDMPERALRLKQCAMSLFFKGEKLDHALFCKVNLCPICAMRRTYKIFGQINKVLKYIDAHDYNYRYLFLTLTVKNVAGDKLGEAMDAMMNGFRLLTRRKMFKEMSCGWFRAMEITHNWVRDDYHHHLHVIVAVKREYFTRYENYVRHEDFRKEWRECMGLDYEPFVRIQRVSRNKSKLGDGAAEYWKAVAEVAKYTVKSADYIVTWKGRAAFEEKTGGKIKIKSKEQCYDLTDGVVAVLDKSLHKRRLVAFGGEFKKIHKLLNLDDPLDGDLINTDNRDSETEIHDELIHYRFFVGYGDYLLVKKIEHKT